MIEETKEVFDPESEPLEEIEETPVKEIKEVEEAEEIGGDSDEEV